MNWLRLYRRLRGGIWLYFYDKSANMGFWRRVKSISEALELSISYHSMGMIQLEKIDALIDAESGANDLNSLIHLYDMSKMIHTANIRDGYHSFSELYTHRTHLFVALINVIAATYNEGHHVWKSWKNKDGSSWDGWFVAGYDDKITYHLPAKLWDKLDCQELPVGLWDGHSSDDVADRLLTIFKKPDI